MGRLFQRPVNRRLPTSLLAAFLERTLQIPGSEWSVRDTLRSSPPPSVGPLLQGTVSTEVLSIARQLDLNVVAEGIETLEQREFLLERTCPEIQGFLYSPPVSPEEFCELLRRGRCDPKPVSER